VAKSLPVVRLKEGEEARIRWGHPWVFATTVAGITGDPGSGDLVAVTGTAGRPVGEGLFSPESRVRVRMMRSGPGAPLLDREGVLALVRERILSAIGLRRRLGAGGGNRMVFGESDGLPGLVVDRYADCAVVQLLSAGMDALRPELAGMLAELVPATLIIERSDTGSREREGLPSARGVLAGSLPDGGLVPFAAGGLNLLADVLEGQKTGFYLDQVDNWTALKPLGEGRRILDVCCYTGSFGLSLLSGGGKELLGVDSSKRALGMAGEHAKMNGLADRARFAAGDAGDTMAALAAAGEKFGFVVLDPSALARTKAHRLLALRTYRALNALALKVIEPGGFLFSCSCTPWVGLPELAGAVATAAREAGRPARLLEVRGQSRDHPVHPEMPETRYLTGTLWNID
jgi:23S rRNA (cytosine1962-C5)-methyltransferase